MRKGFFIIAKRTFDRGWRLLLAFLLLSTVYTCGDFTLWEAEEESTTNSAPTAYLTASATDPQACSLSQIYLYGAESSDPEDDTLTYSWSVVKPAESAALLLSANSSSNSIIPDKPGDYTVTLTVSDGSLSDTADITITAGSQPIAVAELVEDQKICLGPANLVNLDGSNSLNPAEDGCANTDLQYTWELDSDSLPADSATAALADENTDSPTLSADVVGDYRVTLAVETGAGVASDEAAVVVSVGPVADAGEDQEGVVGDEVTLDGSNSVNPVTCDATEGLVWEITESPPGASAPNLSDSTTDEPKFTPDQFGTYVITLTVTAEELSAVDQVEVTVPVPISALEKGSYTLALGSIVDTVFGGALENFVSGIIGNNSTLSQAMYIPDLVQVVAAGEDGYPVEDYHLIFQVPDVGSADIGAIDLIIKRQGADEFYTVTGSGNIGVSGCFIQVGNISEGTITPTTATTVDISFPLADVLSSGAFCSQFSLDDPDATGTVVINMTGTLNE